MQTTATFRCPWGRWCPALFAALVLAGLAGNHLSYPIFLNIDFLFGGIFAMLALQFFGLWPGVLAAALIASYTVVLWKHPYAIVILSAEVAVVGTLMTRRKMGMVAADAVYWVVAGLPLVYVFYHFVLKVPDSSVWIIAVKQAVNGITGALLARLIYSSLGVGLQCWQRSMGEVMSNLLVLFVVLPSLLILGVSSREDFEHADGHLRQGLIEHASNTKALFQHWVKDRKDAVLELATVANTMPAAQFNERLELLRKADTNILRIGRRDKDSVVLAYAPLMDASGVSNVGKKFPERPYIAKLRQTGQPMLAEVVMGRIDKPQPVAILLAPVLKQSQFDGYVNAVLKLDAVQDMLKHGVQDRYALFTLLDQNGNVVLSNRPGQTMMTPLQREKRGTLTPLGDGLMQWLPEVPANTSISDRWRQSYYVFETPLGLNDEWKLVFEEPVAPVQHLLYTHYARQLGIVFLLILLSVMLAEYLSRRSVATLRALSDTTHELASKISSGVQAIAWPRSAMQETTELTNNFKGMAVSLADTFAQLRQVNATLEQQVLDRTQALHVSEQRFRQLVAWTPQPMAVHRDGKFIFANPAACQLFGAPSERELLGTDVLARVHPDYRDVVLKRIAHAQQEHAENPTIEEKLIRLDGSVLEVEVAAVPIDFDGEPAIQVAMHDVTEKKRTQRELEQLLREQQAVLNNELVGIVRVKDRHVVWANAAFEKMLGYAPGQAQGTPTRQNYPSDEAYQRLGKAAYPVLAAGKIFRTQIEHVRQDGSMIWVDISGTVLNATTNETLWTFSDITEHKQAENAVHEQAFHDALTQLPNRRMLNDRLAQVMAGSQRSGIYGALMFLDLDNFKPLNDRHGHEMGDLLLMEVARRLHNCVREMDTVARMGGDEFVVLISELSTDSIASQSQSLIIAEKIRVSLEQPYVLLGHEQPGAAVRIEHHCTASIGVVVFKGQTKSQDAVLEQADQAMYQAKAAGRNMVRLYEPPALANA